MGTIQNSINTIIGAAAGVATAIDKSRKPQEPQEPQEPSSNTVKPNNENIGNQRAQEAINKRYQQDKDFAARLDKAKANTAKRASQMIEANQKELERQKLEKKKNKSIEILNNLKKKNEGGDK